MRKTARLKKSARALANNPAALRGAKPYLRAQARAPDPAF